MALSRPIYCPLYPGGLDLHVIANDRTYHQVKELGDPSLEQAVRTPGAFVYGQPDAIWLLLAYMNWQGDFRLVFDGPNNIATMGHPETDVYVTDDFTS